MTTLGELGEFPLLLHGLISLLCFWHRTMHMHGDTLVKQTLDFISHDDSSISEWFSTVKFLLSYLDMDNYFQNPHSVNTVTFTTLCKSKLKQKFVEEWRDQLAGISMNEGQTSKLRFYKLFKKSFEREPYLDFINNFNLRRTVTKFRCSDHSLEIELGRHKKLKVEERICKLCKTDVETELHFLQFCPVYTQLRTRYLKTPQINDWFEILECKDKETAFIVANFLEKAFKLRKGLLALP